MSCVDDLQAAEDHLGDLASRLAELVQAVEGEVEAGALTDLLDLAGPLQRAATASSWCRPSCEDHDHANPSDEEAEYCGCPAHASEEPT